jgi:hypothetical protein
MRHDPNVPQVFEVKSHTDNILFSGVKGKASLLFKIFKNADSILKREKMLRKPRLESGILIFLQGRWAMSLDFFYNPVAVFGQPLKRRPFWEILPY